MTALAQARPLQQPVTLRRGLRTPHGRRRWSISATHLTLISDTGGWKVVSHVPAVTRWLTDAGLDRVSLPTRQALIDVLIAHDAARPMPAADLVAGAGPVLRPVRAGLWQTRCGRYTARRDRPERLWQITDERNPPRSEKPPRLGYETIGHAQRAVDAQHAHNPAETDLRRHPAAGPEADTVPS